MLLLFNSGSGSTTTINTLGFPLRVNVRIMQRNTLREVPPLFENPNYVPDQCRSPDDGRGTDPALGSALVPVGPTDEEGYQDLRAQALHQKENVHPVDSQQNQSEEAR